MTELLAHGIGERGDLPLPLTALVIGAATAVVISFVALSLTWRTSRFSALSGGRSLVAIRHPLLLVLGALGRLLGLALVFVGLASAVFVTNNTVENISPRIVYVALWVVIPVLSFAVGDLWRWLSPFELLARGVDQIRGRAAEPGVDDYSRFTLYIPAVGLLVFHWLELAYHEPATAPALAMLLGAWIVVSVYAAVRYGTAGLRSRDPLAVWCRLLGSGAPLFVRDGRLALRPPFVGLSAVPIQRGIALLVLTVLGGTTFDGVTRTDWWADLIGSRLGWSATVVRSVGLLFTIGVVFVVYLAAIQLMQRLSGVSNRHFDDIFALALIPVAVGYSIAHYFSLAVFEGQFLLIQASDPFALGWDLPVPGPQFVDYQAVGVDAIAWVQALGIIVGHLAGVVVGHDRALAELPSEDFERSQLPLIGLMVALTCFGLLLLVEA